PAPAPATAAAVEAPVASRALPGEAAPPNGGAVLIERRRTGTPEVGTPVVTAPSVVQPVVQPAVAGVVVDKRYEPTDKIERVRAPIVAEPRAKRASSQGSLGESSASWYEEGERAAAA